MPSFDLASIGLTGGPNGRFIAPYPNQQPVIELSVPEARRLVLGAQGFDGRRPADRVGLPQLRRVLRRTNLFQIDSVNVLVRAHYMPLYSRLGPYRRELL